MKTFEKINLIVHFASYIDVVVIVFLLSIYQQSSLELPLLITPVSLLHKLAWLIPILALCVATIREKIKRNCNAWISLYPCFLFLVYLLSWVTQCGLFVTITGGV